MCDAAVENGVRIFHGHHDPHRTTAERFGAEVEVLRRLVGEPELGAPDGQSGDDLSGRAVDAEQLVSSERGLAAGAKVVWPVSGQYGWRIGRVVDPFGHHWEIGKPLPEAA